MLETIIFSTLFVVIVILVIYKICKWIFIVKRMSRVPGPKTLPFLGIFLEVRNKSPVELFNIHRKWNSEHGSLYQYSVFGMYKLNIAGPEEFEIVASKMKHLSKSREYGLMDEWLGKGLLISSGSQWQQRRKIMTPAFHFGILQEFVNVFNNQTDRCLEVLKEETKKASTNLLPIISQMTLYIIAESSFGTKLDVKNKTHKDYISAIYGIGKIIIYRTLRPWFHYTFIFNTFSSLRNKNKELLSTLNGFTERIIKERSKNFETFEENDMKTNKLTFLDLLLNAKLSKGIIDDEGIKDEVNTFMFEGHDTTSNAISYSLFLLAKHHKYQDLIYEEITSILGSKKHPDLQDLNDLKVLERFIKESLRLYPSVPFIGRALDEDITLNGYEIPKEVQVNIHVYDIHRNPQHWPEPEKFDIDRFLPENCVNRHPYAYVPFSAGPRNCIGQRFAMLEVKAVLCGIVRNFVLEPAENFKTLDFEMDLVLRPANESLRIKLKPRNTI